MGSIAIDPRWEARERLAVERVGWISHPDFTWHPVKEWGFSLCLIPRTRRALNEQTRDPVWVVTEISVRLLTGSPATSYATRWGRVHAPFPSR
jgi:hypothetical protein